MWSGANNTWPSNWALCNGSNGTPNLQGRFVLSSGVLGTSTRTLGQTGGAETVTLTEAQMPSHSHGVSASTDKQGGHSHTATVTDTGHFHGYNGKGGPLYPGNPNNGVSGWGSFSSGALPFQATSTDTTGISVSIDEKGGHTHTVTVTETAKGSGTAHENMPPFYVLAFIMRVS